MDLFAAQLQSLVIILSLNSNLKRKGESEQSSVGVVGVGAVGVGTVGVGAVGVGAVGVGAVGVGAVGPSGFNSPVQAVLIHLYKHLFGVRKYCSLVHQ